MQQEDNAVKTKPLFLRSVSSSKRDTMLVYPLEVALESMATTLFT